jgi:uncharacterized protein
MIGNAQDVAQQGYDACVRGDVIRVPGVVSQAAILASRATPKWLLRLVSGAMVRTLK